MSLSLLGIVLRVRPIGKHYFAETDYFFRSYLDLRAPGISTAWGDAETARRAVQEGHERYRAGASGR